MSCLTESVKPQLELRAAVSTDSDKGLKGQYLARLSPDGLNLLKGKCFLAGAELLL